MGLKGYRLWAMGQLDSTAEPHLGVLFAIPAPTATSSGGYRIFLLGPSPTSGVGVPVPSSPPRVVPIPAVSPAASTSLAASAGNVVVVFRRGAPSPTTTASAARVLRRVGSVSSSSVIVTAPPSPTAAPCTSHIYIVRCVLCIAAAPTDIVVCIVSITAAAAVVVGGVGVGACWSSGGLKFGRS
jgi:hypothetical protein